MQRKLNLLNTSEVQVDPATKQGQDSALAQLTEAVTKLTSVASTIIDGSQKSQLVDENGNASHSTQDVNGEWHTGVHAIQHIIKIDGNSSNENIDAGEIWIGSPTSTTGANLISITFNADQNCSIFIDQSDDGVNWDVSDIGYFTNFKRNFSLASRVVGLFFRVRVENTSSIATTELRLSTTIQPIGNVLPRSLCPMTGCLKTVVHNTSDSNNFNAENTPTGERRSSSISVIAGSPFDGDIIDNSFWSKEEINDGSIIIGDGKALVSTNTTANGAARLWSSQRGMYLPNNSNRFRSAAKFSAGNQDNITRLGVAYGQTMPTITDAALFVQDGATSSLKIHVYKNGVLTEITEFNGNLGSSIKNDNNIHVFEIYYSASSISFSYDNVLLHEIESTNNRWSNTSSLYIYADCVNANLATTYNSLSIESIGITRFGKFSGQHIYDYQSGEIASKVIKRSIGLLSSIVISNISNTSNVTFYDSTTASGDIIFSTGGMSSQSIPLNINMKDIQFNNGLTLAITGAGCNVTTIYS